MNHQDHSRPRVRLALAALAAACASPMAMAAARSTQDASGSYSDEVTIAVPGESISGSTSGRDAQGAVPRRNQELLDQVMSALLDNPQLRGARVHVEVENGRVVLTGDAKDAAQARYVREAAQAAAGNATVESRLDAG
jgi:osmotically-inducible protein OsmY